MRRLGSAGVDARRANVARIYAYLLGRSHNFLADQDVGWAIMAIEPNVRAIGRANRGGLAGVGRKAGLRPPRYWPSGAAGRRSRPRSSAGAEWVSAPTER